MAIYELKQTINKNPCSLNDRALKEVIESKLEASINSVKLIHHLGQSNVRSQRPVILHLMNYQRKYVILQKYSKLKGAKLSAKIFPTGCVLSGDFFGTAPS